MEAYKPESLQRRKTACLRALGANSVMQARLLLARWPDRLPTVLSALLIGVTDFFRDPQVFEALAGLLRQGGRPMRVWSAGCSNGAELYSVAMLLEQAGLLEGSQLIGTDCRPDAIAQAVAGRYDPAAATGIPADLLCRYGQFEEGSFRISNRLRQAVKFRTGNLLAGIEPGGWDMILCRNMAIYLQPEVVGKLWIALQGALSPGGLLMLGRAERPMGTTRLRPAGPMLWRRSEGM
jgi:chemotaxis methyl-accepting protein methylase